MTTTDSSQRRYEVRCLVCNRLLGVVRVLEGEVVFETKCPSCKSLVSVSMAGDEVSVKVLPQVF